MSALTMILQALAERTVARQVGLPHDQARMNFRPPSNTVRLYEEYTDLLALYIQDVHRSCITPGSAPSRAAAAGQAKEILNRELRRQGGDATSAFHDCVDGVNGGVRFVLDTLCDGMKAEAVEYYTRDIFDQYLPPDNWPLRVQTVREFIDTYRPALEGIDHRNPERYARDVESLVRAVLQASRQMGSVFRRM